MATRCDAKKALNLVKSSSIWHGQQLTLVAGSLGTVNPAVVNLEAGSCMHQRSA